MPEEDPLVVNQAGGTLWYCTSSIVGSRVYGNPLGALFAHYSIVWIVISSVVGTRVVAVL